MKERVTNPYLSVISFWPILLLVGFASAFFLPAVIVGYRWTVEFSLAAFLLVAFLSLIITQEKYISPFSIGTRSLIFYPLALFALWSSCSMFWANSYRNALHHSLLWLCYIAFYQLVSNELRSESRRNYAFLIAGGVIVAISVACLLEYVCDARSDPTDFIVRYYPYAEIGSASLPLLVSFAIEKSGKASRYAFVALAIVWAMIVVTASRAMFISGLAGVFAYFGCRWFINRKVSNHMRWLFVGGILILILFFAQSSMVQTPTSLVDRLSGRDEFSNLSISSRTLLWGMAVEGWRQNPLIGIGADNYFTNSRRLRESFSEHNPQSPSLEINDDFVSERAHNEYLQILCELGIIGGALFGSLVCGILYLFYKAVRGKASEITLAALCGLVAFLISSSSSSYSFRFPANGLVFFFLLGIASVKLFEPSDRSMGSFFPRSLRHKSFLVFGIVVAVSMLLFSAVRGVSIRHLANFQNTKDETIARTEIEKAIAIDPEEPLFRFYYGQRLYVDGNDAEVLPHIRFAIDHGISTPNSYFILATAYLRSEQNDGAFQTFQEAVRVFPRSVFLRTAFSSYLKKIGKEELSKNEYREAATVNEKQARSWQLAHDDGLERLAQVSRIDESYVSTFQLWPASAALTLDNFQKTSKQVKSTEGT